MKYRDHPGMSFPLGATITPEGVNFAIYSKRAEHLELLLFEGEDSPLPFAVYNLTPGKNQTSNYWHIFLEGVKADQVYAWRAHGAFEPESGLRFDADKVLIDPYARGIVGWDHYSRQAATDKGDNLASSLRSVVVDCQAYDWEHDVSPAIPYASTVIYELHVGGFTKNANSCVSPHKRGTYAGLIEKLPYLKELGVTTLELMPVQAFDVFDAPPGLTNYWGYSPIGFFAPHMGYSSEKTARGALTEFRDMVKACHSSGLEVILDVVFNHTAEGDEKGPTISFKGLDNLTYYTLDEANGSYKNFSGCGNTLRAEHPIVSRLIVDALRFWVKQMHVDGFRFDLASVLSRDIFGRPQERPPVLWAIESDPVLASSKLIAEAWDPAGLYQVGWFVNQGSRFAEWNGPFRDDVRRFVKGDRNTVIPLAKRLTGSSDIYAQANRDPNRSIHFITCHDGFTLNDLVTYNSKHNEANLENNKDGHDNNYSWNCGVEGPVDDRAVENLRVKQIKNLLAVLFLSTGTPMIAMGDEVRRTTKGNNNPYCQDNELTWFDWDLVAKNRDLFEFTKRLISFSQRLSLYRKEHVVHDNGHWPESTHHDCGSRLAWSNLTWHGVRLGEPDFSADSHSLAFELKDPHSGEDIYVACNAFWEPLSFQLPPAKAGERWHKVMDTALSHPDDLSDLQSLPVVGGDSVTVDSRSTIVLINTNALSSSSRRRAEPATLRRNKGITWTSLDKPALS